MNEIHRLCVEPGNEVRRCEGRPVNVVHRRRILKYALTRRGFFFSRRTKLTLTFSTLSGRESHCGISGTRLQKTVRLVRPGSIGNSGTILLGLIPGQQAIRPVVATV